MAQMLGKGIVLFFHVRSTRRFSGQQHAPAAIYHRERSRTHFRGSWVGVRAGLRCGKFVTTGIRSGIVQAGVAQSLCRLNYSGPHQSLIYPFNSRITPCANSATSCRQHLSTKYLLRTAKTDSNSSDTIA